MLLRAVPENFPRVCMGIALENASLNHWQSPAIRQLLPEVLGMMTAVYRHINANGETLYIGCSVNPMQRFGTHKSQSPWATEVKRIEIEWFDTQDAALAEEHRLIHSERPPRNRQANRALIAARQPSSGPIYLAAWMRRFGVTEKRLAGALGAQEVKSLLSPTARPRNHKQHVISVVSRGYVPRSAWNHGVPFCELSPDVAEREAADCRLRLANWGYPIPEPIAARVVT